jgi:hypothetical protein
MKPNDYLKKILDQQTFDDQEQEMKDLLKRREDIGKGLRTHFSKSSPSICWAGSRAKRTMIRESYDGDVTCYFPHDESEAGDNLAEIYSNAVEALTADYFVERKPSAIRVRDKELKTDLHVDVVPGRYTTEDKDDVFLHRSSGEKQRLKTNPQIHIAHIRDSGQTDAIRLAKLWKVRNGLTAKTFVLELLVVKLLKDKKSSGLSTQLEHVWTEFRDRPDSLCVEDPANPQGNDLKPLLDQVRQQLAMVANTTLASIEESGWESVFGAVDADDGGADDDDKKAGLSAAVAHVKKHVSNPTKPWIDRA